MSNKQETIQLPSMLSFERKLETSDALMYSGSWGDIEKADAWAFIPITKRYNRSTQSAYALEDGDVKKTSPNPVASNSDDANLPIDKDTLKVTFSLRVIGDLGRPFACNSTVFEKAIKEKVKIFIGKDGEGLNTLAFRYAYNIANGRFLWRNRVCAENIKVYVEYDQEKSTFYPYDFHLKDFDKNSSNDDLIKLAQFIQKGLTCENDFVFIKINAFVKLGNGQHIFPSEEMNMNEKGKTLFQLDNCAAIHNVKIGNALRTIDDWYGDTMLIKDDQDEKKALTISIEYSEKPPIAIEPYGAVTQRGAAYRDKDIDLYTLMLAWVNGNEITDDNKNYVVANLIRGGVYSRKK
ncbi:MAG: type I-F CRISPR-associated protein Csy3 [SAR324 cluster bacterium]|nr:type I-F CRISPR-associated protein Csy3 [SAR324 cluster bacterium]MBL7035518.1 type I-F CRISPR-associated protein Csy3 [SAR324 cluster bacterium]